MCWHSFNHLYMNTAMLNLAEKTSAIEITSDFCMHQDLLSLKGAIKLVYSFTSLYDILLLWRQTFTTKQSMQNLNLHIFMHLNWNAVSHNTAVGGITSYFFGWSYTTLSTDPLSILLSAWSLAPLTGIRFVVLVATLLHCCKRPRILCHVLSLTARFIPTF
jgi:hypothetical protein